MRRYERPVFNLIVRMVGDPALAEDVTQETFVKAFAALGRFDTGKRLASWLFRIAHRAAIDALRRVDPGRHEPMDEVPVPAGGSNPEDEAVAAAFARALEAALGGLPREHRAALVLRYQEGLSYGEIGRVMRVREGTVKTYVHRARRALAERLERMGWAPE